MRIWPEEIVDDDGVIFNWSKKYGAYIEMSKDFDVATYCDEKTLAVDIGCTIGTGENWIERFLDRGFEHVVAFEPNPIGWDLTYEKYKDDRRITLYHMAIAPEGYDSITMKFCHDRGAGKKAPLTPGGWISTEINLRDVRPSYEDYKVEATTLDVFNIKPQVIKIDVDGADLSVLRASEATLSTCKCVIIEHKWDEEEIGEFLTERGFKFKEKSGQDSFFVRE